MKPGVEHSYHKIGLLGTIGLYIRSLLSRLYLSNSSTKLIQVYVYKNELIKKEKNKQKTRKEGKERVWVLVSKNSLHR